MQNETLTKIWTTKKRAKTAIDFEQKVPKPQTRDERQQGVVAALVGIAVGSNSTLDNRSGLLLNQSHSQCSH